VYSQGIVMNCHEVSEVADLYFSGELDVESVVLVRSHLQTCAACAADLGQVAEMDARIRGAILEEPVNTASLDQKVRESITRPSRRWMGVAAGIAAMLIASFVAFRTWASPERDCTAAATDHRREVVDGERRAWLYRTGAIEALAAREGIDGSTISRLNTAGWHLERGKRCRLDGRVFMHLVYSKGGENVSVFLRKESGDRHAVRKLEVSGEQLAYFDTARVRAIVVSNGGEGSAELARVAEQIL
jgi:anti-sigma factor RsiW